MALTVFRIRIRMDSIFDSYFAHETNRIRVKKMHRQGMGGHPASETLEAGLRILSILAGSGSCKSEYKKTGYGSCLHSYTINSNMQISLDIFMLTFFT